MAKIPLRTATLSLVVCSIAFAVDAPPETRVVPAVDQLFGLTLPDPYRWMEGANNAEFNAWLGAEGARTRTRLDALPTIGAWRDHMKAASAKTTINRLQRRVGSRLFFLRIEAGRPGTLMVREADGKERILLDPNPSAAPTVPASVTQYQPSPDGKMVAVNVDRGGDEITQVIVIDVDHGTVLPDSLEAIWGEFEVHWLQDGSGFTYTQMASKDHLEGGDPMTNMRTRIHSLGKPPKDDPVLLGSGINPDAPIEPKEFPVILGDFDSSFAVAVADGAHPEQRVWVAPKAEALAPGATWETVATLEDGVHDLDVHASVLYLMSVKGAPNGRILALDLGRKPLSLARAAVIIPESADAVITGIACAHDALYVRRMTGGLDSFLRVPYGGDRPEELSVPFKGASYLMDAQAKGDGLVFTLQGWTRPRVAYYYDPSSHSLVDLNLGANAPEDYSDLEAAETEAVNPDGTHVPLSIVYRKGTRRDGSNLALLDGYGGYGISEQPYFDPALLEWAKAGHVLAFAHVRGGGDKGDAWRLGGKPPHKENGVTDFIACAKELANLGFTTPGRTAAEGASAGGLLIGGAITRAPEAFGAASIHAGILNPVRLLAGANGANQIAELGDPRTEEGLKEIAAMDPYMRIKEGVRYPAVILEVGLNDSRVPTWESGKFGARLLAVQPQEHSVWFRTNGEAGHLSDSEDEEGQELADEFAFLETALH
jgi:prolyl oligopeptidase